MSITPVTPNFNLKSFWKKPEGKAGAIILFGGGIAGLYGLAAILPWMIALLANTIYAAGLGIALFALLAIISNKTFRSIVKNSFQLGMRWMTSILIEIDPIGILKNTLDKMRDRKTELDAGVGGCAGAKKRLETQIEKNSGQINHTRSLIDEVARKLAGQRLDQLTYQSLTLQKQRYLQEVGRRMHSNENLQRILDQTNRMYVMLTRWQQLAEYNIENTDAEIKNAEDERKSILATYKSLGPAQKLIKGDPEELKMMNAALEFLAEDNANKLGAMEDFARYSEKFLTNMDIEQGASAEDAEKMLTAFEQKLLVTGSPSPTIPNSQQPEPEKQPIEVDYFKH
jgi:hypothetical protein